MKQYKRLDKLYERAKTFNPKKRKLAIEILNEESRDLGFWPEYYKEILRDAKQALDAIEKEDNINI
jgi:hypothetical protein